VAYHDHADDHYNADDDRRAGRSTHSATDARRVDYPDHAHRGHRHDIGLAHFQHRHRHADQQFAVARGFPALALGDHAAVAAGATDRDHVAAGPVMRRRT
jgi:hypothetical protein